ncbi:hypothetical protein CHLNCDRAFT_135614 [Chlorella variabilis]|uniref:Transmembrane protein n=1 Tax=Chlorella variabilis TaxID=554065 RepID=E1ZIK9_CHLVA|nr:hypothetical protein CHLNCDRAFT_135614 [Chlorella variabilis]EFN54176.1 hypothetical protein CHLNCDRAFT_135614 [Chlorella variabilis]|eukprot:XP_005846278.1 hypothetical protein CHLNCDRAFT_135614 [Chlorella variabilis]
MPDGTAVVTRQASPSLAVAVFRFPQRHPRAAGFFLVWLLGLYCAFLARPPAITDEQTTAFKVKVQEAEVILGELARAEQVLMEAELEQQQFKVWFWRFKPEARTEVEARQPAVDAARAVAREIQGRRDKVLREAKAVLGLWSEAGVEEGRELFWESFNSGKVFAQRQTFIDSIFTILDSRDRDWISMLLQLLFQTLINFFTGLCASVFIFLLQLPSLIWSYQASVWSAVSFFALAGVAAVSVVAAYLGLLFGAGGVVAYSTVHLVVQQAARLEAGREQQRRRLDYDRREHHD